MRPKPNNCDVLFHCSKEKNCVYAKGKPCEYKIGDVCMGIVPRVNAMVVKLKEYGLILKEE